MSFNEPPRDLNDIYGPGSEEADAMADRDAEILDQAIKNVGDATDTEQVVFEALKLERKNPWRG